MAQILIVLILLGLLLYIVGLLPIDGTIKQIIKAVAIVIVAVWIIQYFIPLGSWGPFFHGR